MISNISSNPVFGILLSLSCFLLGKIISDKMRHPIFNPILIAIVLIISFLKIWDIEYEVYREQNIPLSYLFGPATVVLAVPLYKNIELLKKNIASILAGVFAGCVASISSVIGFGLLMGADREMLLTLSPKAVTTPIAMEISRILGGIPALTAGLVAITGVFGACFGPELLKLFGIKNKIAIGLAIGTTTHALGTARAFELGEIEGSMSSLSIALAGLFTAILAPYVALLIK